MRPFKTFLALAGLTLLAACATPDSRISDNRSAFDKLPPDIQQKIRTGQVDIGFTAEMVVMALGEPARKFTRKTDLGDAEVWSYHDDSPKFSFGLGVGSGGRRSSVGGGVGVSTGGYDPEEKMRVEFRDGKVAAIEYVKH